MKRALKYGIAAVLTATLSASLLADSEDAHAQTADNQPSVASYVVKQALKDFNVKDPVQHRTLKELALSLRNKSGQQSKPFTLSDSRSFQPLDKKELDSKPDFSSLLSLSGQSSKAFGESIFDKSSRIDLTLGRKKGEENGGVNIAVESSYKLTLQGLQSVTAFVDSSLANREENLGVAIGYQGFGVDASVTRQTNLFERDAIGYDVGLSYHDDAFGARLSLSEYTEGADLYGIENQARNVISVELGASYRLTDYIGLTGGVRYYDYGDRWLVNSEAGENAQSIFLGGRLKF